MFKLRRRGGAWTETLEHCVGCCRVSCAGQLARAYGHSLTVRHDVWLVGERCGRCRWRYSDKRMYERQDETLRYSPYTTDMLAVDARLDKLEGAALWMELCVGLSIPNSDGALYGVTFSVSCAYSDDWTSERLVISVEGRVK